MESLATQQVRVGGEIGRRMELTARGNILKLDLENDFLRPFRGNWDFRTQGDFIGTGKLFDGVTRLARNLNDPELTALRVRLRDELEKCQGADGYIGIMKPADRLGNLWDMHEMSFIMVGLSADAVYWNDAKSLDMAKRLAGFFMKALAERPDFVPKNDNGTTGVDNGFLAVYQATGDRTYVDFLRKYRRTADWYLPIVQGRWGGITGHIYNYLDAVIARMRARDLEGEDWRDGPVEEVLDFLFRGDGMTISGELGEYECWTDFQEGTRGLGETCATVYYLFFLDELLKRTGNPFFGDVMERIVYNGLFGAQSADGRKIRYYTPFEGERGYFCHDYYCCPNNYRRGVSRLPEMIFYTDGDGAAVNLYTACDASLTLADGTKLRLRQETDYPSTGNVQIGVEPEREAEFTLKLRIPRWCCGASVSVNGKTAGAAEPGFFALRRVWKKGDRVELELPMAFRAVAGRKRQARKAAVLRGPVIYCLNPDKNPGINPGLLNLLVLDRASLKGPFGDDSVRPGGVSCTADFWTPTTDSFHELAMIHCPEGNPDRTVTLTEFPDAGGKATYFKVPDPTSPEIVRDELCLDDPAGELLGR